MKKSLRFKYLLWKRNRCWKIVKDLEKYWWMWVEYRGNAMYLERKLSREFKAEFDKILKIERLNRENKWMKKYPID